MKHLLLVLSLVSVQAFAQESLVNGWMPPYSPASIEVANVPMGSGVPSAGQTTGYSEATPVSDGLYQVPGYLPYQSTASALWPRVVDVQCHNKAGIWYCTGYRIDGVLGRGENIYVRPEFIKTQILVPLVQPLSPPIIKSALAETPVPHVHHLLKPKKQICN